MFVLLLFVLALTVKSETNSTMTPEPDEGEDGEENQGDTSTHDENNQQVSEEQMQQEFNNASCMVKSKCQLEIKNFVVYCVGFKSFSEIRLDCNEIVNSRLFEYIQDIYLKPSEPIRVDSTFDASKIKLQIKYFHFSGINGIEIVNSSLAKIESLHVIDFSSSQIDFYKNGKLLREND